MHCRDCDYPLWNLKARQCPECGAAFAPSEFEFVPQSVRFCCPHCDHPYYGTGERGHVEPQAFACLRCGRPVTMDEMVLRPGLGVQEQLTRPETMPWLDRRERGRVRAWFQMIGRGLTAPTSLIAATPAESPLPQAWMFAAVSTAVFVFGGSWLNAWGLAQYVALWRTWNPVLPWFGGLSPLVLTAVLLGAIFVFAMLLLLLWTLSAHGILRITGGAPHGYRRTCQALLYSAGANVFGIVPCCGSFVGGLWWMFSGILMTQRGQGVHGLRAALAVGALPGVLLLAQGGLYASWVVAMGGGMGRAATGPWSLGPSSPHFQTSVVTFSVVYHGQQHAGNGPEHAVELLLTDTASTFGWNLTAPLVCDPGTATTAKDVPVGDGTLEDFEAAGRGAQLRAVSNEIEALPAGVVAHRLGDFVFTYHGAKLNTFNAKLWVVVMLPDPDVNGPPAAGDPVLIGTADYNVIETTAGQLSELIAAQNRRRAKLKLPPLPDLLQVTHDRPAVAPATSGAANSEPNG